MVFGKSNTTAVTVTDLALDAGGYKINGVANELVGRAISNAGDINDDGKLDLIVGALGGLKIYVVYGQ